MSKEARLLQKQIDFFTDPNFENFRGKTLDGEMKRLCTIGLGTHKKVDTKTDTEKEFLWQKGILGDHSPQALLNTAFFMAGT